MSLVRDVLNQKGNDVATIDCGADALDAGKLAGIISSGDILSRELVDQEETIRYLHETMHGPG